MKHSENILTEAIITFFENVGVLITTKTLDYQYLPIPVKKKPVFKKR